MKKLIPILLLPLSLSAQTLTPLWTRLEIANGSATPTYTYQTPLLITDAAHNPVICASAYNAGPGKGFLTTKYDQNGTLLWQNLYNPGGNDDIIDAAAAKENNAVYVGGNSRLNSVSGELPGTLVFKYADDGSILWTYNFEGPGIGANYLAELELDAQGNLLVFGTYINLNAARAGLFVSKVSPDGQEIWRNTVIDNQYGFGGTTVKKVGDKWIFWGRNGSSSGNRYLCWQISDDGLSLGSAVSQSDGENGVVLKYHTDQEGNLYASGRIKYRVFKLNTEAALVWDYTQLVTNPPATGVSAEITNITSDSITGAVLIAGVYWADSIGLIPLFSKLDAQGQLVWQQTCSINNYPQSGFESSLWLDETRILFGGGVSRSLDSNYYEMALALVDLNEGFLKGWEIDVEGRRNQIRDLHCDGTFIYVSGNRASDQSSVDQKQILCKFELDAITATSTPQNTTVRAPLKISPNPASFFATIEFPENAVHAQPSVLSVLDAGGRVVSKQAIPGGNRSITYPLHTLPAGAYQVQLQTPGGTLYYGKLIKGN